MLRPPLQVKHVASQGSQVNVALTYFVLTHVSQLVGRVLQVRHDGSQALQAPPTSSSAGAHVKHSVVRLPEQVKQVGSQQ